MTDVTLHYYNTVILVFFLFKHQNCSNRTGRIILKTQQTLNQETSLEVI